MVRTTFNPDTQPVTGVENQPPVAPDSFLETSPDLPPVDTSNIIVPPALLHPSDGTLQPVPLRGADDPAPSTMEELTRSALAEGALDPETLAGLYDGSIRISLRYVNNNDGLEGYYLLVSRGFDNPVPIAKYITDEHGQVTCTSSDDPVSKGIIAFLQRLLMANEHLSPDEFTEGEFNKNTFDKLQRFLTDKNLMRDFNAGTNNGLLDERVKEANEAAQSLAAAPAVPEMEALNNFLKALQEYNDAKYYYHKESNSHYGQVPEDVRTRYNDAQQKYNDARKALEAKLNTLIDGASLRYGLVKQALEKSSAVLSLVNQYKDLSLDGLSEEEQTFVLRCRIPQSSTRNWHAPT